MATVGQNGSRRSRKKGKVLHDGLPQGAPLRWASLPLDSKLPMLPGAKEAVVLCTTKLSEQLRQQTPRLEFDLTDPLCQLMSSEYHPLHDPHLKTLMSSSDMRRRLYRGGFITKDGRVLCTLKEFNEFRRYLRRLYLAIEKQQKKSTSKRVKLKRDISPQMLTREYSENIQQIKEKLRNRYESDRERIQKILDIDQERNMKRFEKLDIPYSKKELRKELKLPTSPAKTNAKRVTFSPGDNGECPNQGEDNHIARMRTPVKEYQQLRAKKLLEQWLQRREYEENLVMEIQSRQLEEEKLKWERVRQRELVMEKMYQKQKRELAQAIARQRQMKEVYDMQCAKRLQYRIARAATMRQGKSKKSSSTEKAQLISNWDLSGLLKTFVGASDIDAQITESKKQCTIFGKKQKDNEKTLEEDSQQESRTFDPDLDEEESLTFSDDKSDVEVANESEALTDECEEEYRLMVINSGGEITHNERLDINQEPQTAEDREAMLNELREENSMLRVAQLHEDEQGKGDDDDNATAEVVAEFISAINVFLAAEVLCPAITKSLVAICDDTPASTKDLPTTTAQDSEITNESDALDSSDADELKSVQFNQMIHILQSMTPECTSEAPDTPEVEAKEDTGDIDSEEEEQIAECINRRLSLAVKDSVHQLKQRRASENVELLLLDRTDSLTRLLYDAIGHVGTMSENERSKLKEVIQTVLRTPSERSSPHSGCLSTSDDFSEGKGSPDVQRSDSVSVFAQYIVKEAVEKGSCMFGSQQSDVSEMKASVPASEEEVKKAASAVQVPEEEVKIAPPVFQVHEEVKEVPSIGRDTEVKKAASVVCEPEQGIQKAPSEIQEPEELKKAASVVQEPEEDVKKVSSAIQDSSLPSSEMSQAECVEAEDNVPDTTIGSSLTAITKAQQHASQKVTEAQGMKCESAASIGLVVKESASVVAQRMVFRAMEVISADTSESALTQQPTTATGSEPQIQVKTSTQDRTDEVVQAQEVTADEKESRSSLQQQKVTLVQSSELSAAESESMLSQNDAQSSTSGLQVVTAAVLEVISKSEKNVSPPQSSERTVSLSASTLADCVVRDAIKRGLKVMSDEDQEKMLDLSKVLVEKAIALTIQGLIGLADEVVNGVIRPSSSSERRAVIKREIEMQKSEDDMGEFASCPDSYYALSSSTLARLSKEEMDVVRKIIEMQKSEECLDRPASKLKSCDALSLPSLSCLSSEETAIVRKIIEMQKSEEEIDSRPSGPDNYQTLSTPSVACLASDETHGDQKLLDVKKTEEEIKSPVPEPRSFLTLSSPILACSTSEERASIRRKIEMQKSDMTIGGSVSKLDSTRAVSSPALTCSSSEERAVVQKIIEMQKSEEELDNLYSYGLLLTKSASVLSCLSNEERAIVQKIIEMQRSEDEVDNPSVWPDSYHALLTSSFTMAADDEVTPRTTPVVSTSLMIEMLERISEGASGTTSGCVPSPISATEGSASLKEDIDPTQQSLLSFAVPEITSTKLEPDCNSLFLQGPRTPVKSLSVCDATPTEESIFPDQDKKVVNEEDTVSQDTLYGQVFPQDGQLVTEAAIAETSVDAEPKPTKSVVASAIVNEVLTQAKTLVSEKDEIQPVSKPPAGSKTIIDSEVAPAVIEQASSELMKETTQSPESLPSPAVSEKSTAPGPSPSTRNLMTDRSASKLGHESVADEFPSKTSIRSAPVDESLSVGAAYSIDGALDHTRTVSLEECKPVAKTSSKSVMPEVKSSKPSLDDNQHKQDHGGSESQKKVSKPVEAVSSFTGTALHATPERSSIETLPGGIFADETSGRRESDISQHAVVMVRAALEKALSSLREQGVPDYPARPSTCSSPVHEFVIGILKKMTKSSSSSELRRPGSREVISSVLKDIVEDMKKECQRSSVSLLIHEILSSARQQAAIKATTGSVLPQVAGKLCSTTSVFVHEVLRRMAGEIRSGGPQRAASAEFFDELIKGTLNTCIDEVRLGMLQPAQLFELTRLILTSHENLETISERSSPRRSQTPVRTTRSLGSAPQSSAAASGTSVKSTAKPERKPEQDSLGRSNEEVSAAKSSGQLLDEFVKLTLEKTLDELQNDAQLQNMMKVSPRSSTTGLMTEMVAGSLYQLIKKKSSSSSKSVDSLRLKNELIMPLLMKLANEIKSEVKRDSPECTAKTKTSEQQSKSKLYQKIKLESTRSDEVNNKQGNNANNAKVMTVSRDSLIACYGSSSVALTAVSDQSSSWLSPSGSSTSSKDLPPVKCGSRNRIGGSKNILSYGSRPNLSRNNANNEAGKSKETGGGSAVKKGSPGKSPAKETTSAHKGLRKSMSDHQRGKSKGQTEGSRPKKNENKSSAACEEGSSGVKRSNTSKEKKVHCDRSTDRKDATTGTTKTTPSSEASKPRKKHAKPLPNFSRCKHFDDRSLLASRRLRMCSSPDISECHSAVLDDIPTRKQQNVDALQHKFAGLSLLTKSVPVIEEDDHLSALQEVHSSTGKADHLDSRSSLPSVISRKLFRSVAHEALNLNDSEGMDLYKSDASIYPDKLEGLDSHESLMERKHSGGFKTYLSGATDDDAQEVEEEIPCRTVRARTRYSNTKSKLNIQTDCNPLLPPTAGSQVSNIQTYCMEGGSSRTPNRRFSDMTPRPSDAFSASSQQVTKLRASHQSFKIADVCSKVNRYPHDKNT